MFDAFHHLEQPEAFLRWLRARTSRCVLIEPAGTATGGWSRDLDLDWLLVDLANIRERLEAFCGEEPASAPPAEPATEDASLVRGQGAVERRYALADFERFFDGWQLRVRGTVAGFDSYPPGATLRGPMRAAMGDVAYSLLRTTEEILLRRNHDGAAKHWVIAATSERDLIEPRLPAMTRSHIDVPPTAVASAYAVRYLRSDGPAMVRAGERFAVSLAFRNDGWAEWSSNGPAPVNVSYHWLTKQGQTHTFDGLRTLLPHPVGPGASCDMTVTIESPQTAGTYLLAIDLVKEGVTWFSETGAPCSTTTVTVTKAGA